MHSRSRNHALVNWILHDLAFFYGKGEDFLDPCHALQYQLEKMGIPQPIYYFEQRPKWANSYAAIFALRLT